MPRTITQRELRNESGKIMRALDRGERFVVTRNGVAVGELAPLRERQLVPVADVVAVFRDAPRLDRERFERDLDAHLEQSPEPRG